MASRILGTLDLLFACREILSHWELTGSEVLQMASSTVSLEQRLMGSMIISCISVMHRIVKTCLLICSQRWNMLGVVKPQICVHFSRQVELSRQVNESIDGLILHHLVSCLLAGLQQAGQLWLALDCSEYLL